MNTTMAPVDQARQDSIADLERRHRYRNELPLEKRSGGGNPGDGRDGDGKRASSGSGSGGGSGSNGGSNLRSGPGSNSKADSSNNNNKDSSGSSAGRGGGSGGGSSNSGSGFGSNNNGGSSGRGNGSGNGGGNSRGGNGSGGRKALNSPDGSPSRESPAPSGPPATTQPPPPPPPAAETTATAVTTIPTTVVVTSTTGAAAVSSAVPSEVSPLAASDSSLTTFPTTTPAPDTLAPNPTSPPDSSSQPRKGLNTEEEDTKINTRLESQQTSTTSTIFVPETILWPSATNRALPAETRPAHPGRGNSISPLAEHVLIAAGAIGALIIIIAGMYLLSRVKKVDLLSVFRNREIRKSESRGWYGWRRKRDNSTSFWTSETRLYGYPPDDKSIPSQREANDFRFPIVIPPKASPEQVSALLETNYQRNGMLREATLTKPSLVGVGPLPMLQPINPPLDILDSNFNNTYDTSTTFLSQNTSEAYDPVQREVNHLSYLSSLSSGFGDAQIIIPESDMAKQNMQDSRKSTHQSRKFSWVSSVPGLRRPGDRDTVYTRSSVESAPRYRTVNSWVAQQHGRVERRREKDREVPSVPELPSQLQSGVDHQRKESENPAFRHHPGDEVEISRGSRVPSAILDRKTGVN